jgi:hypothetical protein
MTDKPPKGADLKTHNPSEPVSNEKRDHHRRRETYDADHRRAEIILADPKRYPGLPLEWAK